MKGTKKEASRELARLVVQVEDGQFFVKTGTVGDLCERWYENGEARWTARTAHGYRRILDLRIIPKFGATPLRKLRASDIDAWYAQARAAGEAGRGGRKVRCAGEC